jgi:hypothetical protein
MSDRLIINFSWKFSHVFNRHLLLIVKETIKLTLIADAKALTFYVRIT